MNNPIRCLPILIDKPKDLFTSTYLENKIEQILLCPVSFLNHYHSLAHYSNISNLKTNEQSNLLSVPHPIDQPKNLFTVAYLKNKTSAPVVRFSLKEKQAEHGPWNQAI